MNTKFKALGLTFAAALALTAVMASAAMASNGFTSSAASTELHGEQEGKHEFTASASSGFGGITCTTVTFAGTGSGTFQTSQTIMPTYAGCEDSFGRTVDVATNSLHFVFTVTGIDKNETPIGIVHVTGHIELTVTTGGTHCKVTISAEQTQGGIIYHNLGGTNGVRVTTATTEVISTTSGGFFACGISNGEHKDGEYTGTTLMKGTSGGEPIPISVDAMAESMTGPGFTSSVANPTLHGEQEGNHEWTFSASSGFGSFTCATATFAGTMSGTFSTSQTITPTYSGCEDSFGRTVDVVTNSLHYIFTVTGTDAQGTPIGNFHMTGHIQITTTTGGTHCTMTISAEQTQGGVTYHNISGSGDVRVTTATSETVSTTSGGFFACGISNGEHTDGEYTGTTTMEATEGTISVDAH
jgi:hypothetical protein